jgi:hypothetical protein
MSNENVNDGLWPLLEQPSQALLAASQEAEAKARAKYFSKFSERTWSIADRLKEELAHSEHQPERIFHQHIDVCREHGGGEWYLSIWCFRPLLYFRLSDEGDRTRIKFCNATDWDDHTTPEEALVTDDIGTATTAEEALALLKIRPEDDAAVSFP